jgi:hypothetical protein
MPLELDQLKLHQKNCMSASIYAVGQDYSSRIGILLVSKDSN